MTIEWNPITDLPEDWSALSVRELKSYQSAWRAFAQKFDNQEVLEEFNRKLRRAWAIETGIIEDLYHVSEGLTRLLVEKGIESSLIPHGTFGDNSESIVSLIKDQEYVAGHLYQLVQSNEKISAHFIRSLHQELTRSQATVEAVDSQGKKLIKPLRKGQWRDQANFSYDQEHGFKRFYCPPEQIDSEVNNLLELHQQHIDSGIPTEIEAAWFHHRLTEIHPFEDGNGRVVRAVASLIFLRGGWFPLIVDRQLRDVYIAALRQADKGNLKPLVVLFADCQKSALKMAMSLGEEPSALVENAIQALKHGIATRKRVEEQRLLAACVSRADKLIDVLFNRMDNLKRELEENLLQEAESFKGVEVHRNKPDQDQYYYGQIVQTARELGYFADVSPFRAWVRLRLHTQRKTDIVFSFHSFGTRFSGMFVVTSFLEHRMRTDDDVELDGPYRLSNQEFKYAWEEDEIDTINRFKEWVEDVILNAIHLWGKGL